MMSMKLVRDDEDVKEEADVHSRRQRERERMSSNGCIASRFRKDRVRSRKSKHDVVEEEENRTGLWFWLSGYPLLTTATPQDRKP